MREGIDEYTLLCEHCGYVIEGLPCPSCPECGKALPENHPERRNRVPGFRDMLLKPVPSFRGMPIEHPDDAGRRTTVRCMVAGILLTTAFVIGWTPWWFVQNNVLYALLLSFVSAILAVLAGSIVGLVLLLLTWIETKGLRLIGNRRGFRVTRAVAETVCSHACAGWVAGGCIWTLGWVIIGAGVAHELLVPLGLLIGMIGLLIGFLGFELLAYLGLRSCKFANRERPANRNNENEPLPSTSRERE